MISNQATSLTFKVAKDRLGGSHENHHPWLPNSVPPSSPANSFTQLANDTTRRPLLRLWDLSSGSQPGEENMMLARADAMKLSSEEERRSTLTWHLDHSRWINTPYISFTSSPSAIEDLARLRTSRHRSGPQRLVAINPQVRLRKQLPILSVESEMQYYGIEDPYKRGREYYKNHYVCLWEIAPDEVIDDWDWHELKAQGNWYEGFVLPAFCQHEEAASGFPTMPSGYQASVQQAEDYSEIPELAQSFAGLSIQHPTRATRRSELLTDNAIELSEGDSHEEHNYDSEGSSVGEYKLDAGKHDEGGCNARDLIEISDDEAGNNAILCNREQTTSGVRV